MCNSHFVCPLSQSQACSLKPGETPDASRNALVVGVHITWPLMAAQSLFLEASGLQKQVIYTKLKPSLRSKLSPPLRLCPTSADGRLTLERRRFQPQKYNSALSVILLDLRPGYLVLPAPNCGVRPFAQIRSLIRAPIVSLSQPLAKWSATASLHLLASRLTPSRRWRALRTQGSWLSLYFFSALERPHFDCLSRRAARSPR